MQHFARATQLGDGAARAGTLRLGVGRAETGAADEVVTRGAAVIIIII
jgi:hypothetical protein